MCENCKHVKVIPKYFGPNGMYIIPQFKKIMNCCQKMIYLDTFAVSQQMKRMYIYHLIKFTLERVAGKIVNLVHFKLRTDRSI